MKADDFTRVPMVELTTPKNGYRCVMNYWWSVTEADEVLFYKGYSPQCNSDKRVVEHVAKDRPIATRAVFVSVAYLPYR